MGRVRKVQHVGGPGPATGRRRERTSSNNSHSHAHRWGTRSCTRPTINTAPVTVHPHSYPQRCRNHRCAKHLATQWDNRALCRPRLSHGCRAAWDQSPAAHAGHGWSLQGLDPRSQMAGAPGLGPALTSSRSPAASPPAPGSASRASHSPQNRCRSGEAVAVLTPRRTRGGRRKPPHMATGTCVCDPGAAGVTVQVLAFPPRAHGLPVAQDCCRQSTGQGSQTADGPCSPTWPKHTDPWPAGSSWAWIGSREGQADGVAE